MQSHLNNPSEDADVIHMVSTRDGLKIRETREALGWSQAELASRAGTYQQMVDRIESGAIKRSKLVPAVKAALGLTLDAHSTIGETIRHARTGKGLGQADVANVLGVTVQAVSQWERDENMPSGINLLKLSGLLGIDLPHGFTVPEQNSDRLAELLEQVEEVCDLLHALDKVGDGIGGSDGFAVSAVALNAKSIADNVIDALKAMGAAR